MHLEHEVECILEVWDNNGNIWKKAWEEIQVTELEIHSPVTFMGH
ncbi:MAG: hypothetical protein ACOCRK_01125 [bacterium]